MAAQRKKDAPGKKDAPSKKDATAKKDAPRKKGGHGKKDAPHQAQLVASAPTQSPQSFSQALRWTQGSILADLDPSGTPGWTQGRAEAEKLLLHSEAEFSLWQEKLYAASRGDSRAAVLLIVQGMDTSGKGGILRHVIGQCDPQGVALTSFKAPTPEERSHPFLWRIRAALPSPGMLGVFDRSQYEDVLIARVQNLAPRSTIARRYSQIVAFENGALKAGITPVKVMLHISADEQAARLQERIERPDKQWKYNPGDIDQRLRWAEYQEAYEIALDKTSTDAAPWFVVPANRKWYARLAVQQLLLEHLRTLSPQWPTPDFSPETERERLWQSTAELASVS